MKYAVVIEKASLSTGRTIDEAERNIRDAISFVPDPTTHVVELDIA